MATVSAFTSPLRLISETHFKSPVNPSFYPNSIHFQTKVCSFSSNNLSSLFKKTTVQATGVVNSSSSTASLDTHLGNWEDPDDGSGSEYEDDDDYVEEEEEENDGSGFQQGNPAGVVDNHTTNQYEEDLVKEVEELLEPEEKAILQQNASANLRKISTAKWKPLQTLALSLQIHSMDKLLEDGLNIDEVDKDGHTALHKAIIGKKEAVISHLLRKGANPHVIDKDGATPLHYAVHVGALQTVKLLLKYNVDVNVADRDGWTPLHIAVQSRNRDIAKVLLVNGADKTRKNKDGKTALDISLCYGKDFKSYDLAKLLKILPVESYL
ncbi:EMBRYO DEFECTIVE 139, embryo defective 506 [Hibiscus trionum]|uniref:EMBRYO DEFECTIVE 139, embryo defective 506 n=1 Tax=Hibiscus trionum TaxID=183268 RepID=A0A9W7LMA0_HIBTR|nr:EMBRYO DEFECTIVE 139, embryo defective 506 [Hibiscus trionum]